MLLDSSLRWGKHLNETVQKVSKFINLLNALVGPEWGIHQKHVTSHRGTLFIVVINRRCFH